MTDPVPSKELVKPTEGPYSVRAAVRDGRRVLEISTDRYGFILAIVEPDDPEMRATAEIMAQSWWKYQEEQRSESQIEHLRRDNVHWENAHKILLAENERLKRANADLLRRNLILSTSPEPADVPSINGSVIDGLEHLLRRESDANVEILPDGSVRAAQPPGDGQ